MEIPFTVIGGYLGAGKTTLLNHILRENDGQRIALLVNDFGDINIDAELIESQDDTIMQLSNGCICCSLAAEFLLGINAILEQDPLPERVIVEASGVSDPNKIAPYGQTPGFSLDGVVVVADAEMVRAKANDKYVGRTVRQQLTSADILILNKVDLVDDGQRQAVRDWLAQVAPQGRIYETQQGVVPLELLLGPEIGRETRPPAPGHESTGHEHASVGFVTWSYVDEAPLQRESFERVLGELPESVVRAKGFLNLHDDPDRRTILQLVGRRWTLSPGRPWGDETPRTRIVWIAERGQFGQARLAEALKACAYR
jgi:G3E family GTPase